MEPRNHLGDDPRVITRSVVLFVGHILFLVHDDDAKICRRRKKRRTRPHDDARVAATDAEERVVSLGDAEPAVNHDNVILEH